MNHLLQSWIKRSIVIGSLAVLGFCGSRLWAQDSDTDVAQTPEEASTTFIALIGAPEGRVRRYHFNDLLSDAKLQHGQVDVEDVSRRLIIRIFQRTETWKWKAVSSTRGDRTTVQLQPAEISPPPVICVQEDGGWKVDLWETSRQWFGSNDPLIKEISKALSAKPSQEPYATNACQSRLKQAGLGMMMYLQDYDLKFPPANKWNDVLKPYVKLEQAFHCPSTGKNNYGYAMNWKLSRQMENDVEQPVNTVLFYESNISARNHNGDGRDLMYRHMQNKRDGANYAFADGHVKWYPQTQPQNFRLHPAATRVSKYFEAPHVTR
jgi:prepilin-type processing-associated H-X9-DG protein